LRNGRYFNWNNFRYVKRYNIIITILDIIHYPCLLLKTQLKSIGLSGLDPVSVLMWNLLRWTQYKELVSVSGPDRRQHFPSEEETESNLRNVVFLNKRQDDG
jgi:hypothetical protein